MSLMLVMGQSVPGPIDEDEQYRKYWNVRHERVHISNAAGSVAHEDYISSTYRDYILSSLTCWSGGRAAYSGRTRASWHSAGSMPEISSFSLATVCKEITS